MKEKENPQLPYYTADSIFFLPRLSLLPGFLRENRSYATTLNEAISSCFPFGKASNIAILNLFYGFEKLLMLYFFSLFSRVFQSSSSVELTR